MPIDTILATDGFRELRTKINDMIDTVNGLGGAASVVNVTTPASPQVLVYDGTFFRNVTLSGDLSINSSGVVTVNSGANNGITKGRQAFIGAMSNIN